MSASTQPPRKLDPESVALRASPRPVVRLNRRLIMVLAGSGAAVVLGWTLWSLRPQSGSTKPGSELYSVDHIARSERVDELPKDYGSLPPTSAPSIPQLGEPLPGDLGPAMVQAKRRTESARVPEQPSAEQLSADDAAKAPVFFGGSAERRRVAPSIDAPASRAAPGSSSASPFQEGPPPELNAIWQSQDGRDTDATVVQNLQARKEAFASPDSPPRTSNSATLKSLESPYTVMAGTIIPAALVTGINSDLPGQVIATVTQPVYDTVSGRYLLIPQGARLLGRYDSQVAFGQRRVLLVWTRLILPDASSIALDKLPGVDPAGYAGLEDGVDWHWDRILAGAALSTLLGIDTQLATPNSSSQGTTLASAGRQSMADTVNQVGQELTRRNLSLQPTLTIRPGLAVNVIVGLDLVLKAYRPLFIRGGSLQ